jgi:hypothetical protein
MVPPSITTAVHSEFVNHSFFLWVSRQIKLGGIMCLKTHNVIANLPAHVRKPKSKYALQVAKNKYHLFNLKILICLCKTYSTFSLSLVNIAETFQHLPCMLSDTPSYHL